MRVPDPAGFEARPNGHRSSVTAYGRAIDRSIPSIRWVTSPPAAGLRAVWRLYLPGGACPAAAVVSPVDWACADERTGRFFPAAPAHAILVTPHHSRDRLSGIGGCLNPSL